MKKLNFILAIGFILISISLIAQPTTTGPWVEASSGKIYLDKAHSDHDRGANGGAAGNSSLGAQADWSVDLQIGSWTPSAAAASWTGPSHNGMGAVGVGTFTAGMTNRASGSNAAVFGFHNVAGPLNSEVTNYPPSDSDSGGQFAFGYGNQATGNYAFSGGEGTTASGTHSFSFGKNTVASGKYSTAIGFETDATDYGSLVIGQYNSSGSSATSASSFSTSAPAFVIGNGTSGSVSDAFKVMFNGNTTISGDDLTIGNLSAFSGSFSQRSAIDVVAHSDGDLLTGYASGSTGDRFNIELDTSNSLAKISSGGGYNLTLSSEGGTITASNNLTVSGDVTISSDARLKSNIVSLGSTISKLLLIDGKSYIMNKSGEEKIGILAQEVQEVFPELVSKDDNEMLSVNYQGLVPVLINAIKEQEDKISRLEKLVEQLISEK